MHIETPQVSVIIPTYNAGRFVAEAIKSVLDQTFADFEVLVIDDGSSDNTAEIVQDFADARVRYIYQDNRGLAGARNTGIRSARGELIALLDADDVWLTNFLERMASILTSNRNLAGVYCGFQYIEQDGTPSPKCVRHVVPSGKLCEALHRASFIVPSTTLMRRSCYVETGLFDEYLRAVEDWDMWLRVSERYTVVGIKDVLVRYRQHPANMTKDLPRMRDAWLKLLDKHWGTDKGNPERWSDDRRVVYGLLCRNQAIGYLALSAYDESARWLADLFQTIPESVRDIDLFYTLACAHQPTHHRGELITLDWVRAENDLSRIVKIATENTSTAVSHAKVFASAYYALGLLHYAGRNLAKAKAYLQQAGSLSPLLIFDCRFAYTLVASQVKTWRVTG
jgi:glycosyltransferase involved in cell wall biosynthesis